MWKKRENYFLYINNTNEDTNNLFCYSKINNINLKLNIPKNLEYTLNIDTISKVSFYVENTSTNTSLAKKYFSSNDPFYTYNTFFTFKINFCLEYLVNEEIKLLNYCDYFKDYININFTTSDIKIKTLAIVLWQDKFKNLLIDITYSININ